MKKCLNSHDKQFLYMPIQTIQPEILLITVLEKHFTNTHTHTPKNCKGDIEIMFISH
jgi:hypothetical protein